MTKLIDDSKATTWGCAFDRHAPQHTVNFRHAKNAHEAAWAITNLIADLEEAQKDLENERARGIHSCHDNCTRDGCVNRRLREELAATRKQLAEARNREQLIRDNLAFERELHASTEAELSCLRKQPEEATAARGNGVLVPAQRLEEMQAEIRALRKQLTEAQALLVSGADLLGKVAMNAVDDFVCASGQKYADLMRQADSSALQATIAEAVEPYRKDAERLDYLQAFARCDPKMDGEHVRWSIHPRPTLRGNTLRAAIDAAIDAAIAENGETNEQTT